MEYLKYILISLGALVGFALIWKRRDRLGIKTSLQAAISCIVLCTLSVLAAEVFATVEALISGEKFSFGAISTYGIYFLCPPVFLLLARALKLNAKSWFDVYALCTPPTMFLLRCCCLASGCCGGCSIGTTGLHWPTREAEMVFYVVMLLVLLRREKRDAAPGTGFPLLMASYGAFRFVEEWFREGTGTSLVHLAHLWSLLAVIIGLGVYFELSSIKAKAGSGHEKRRASK